MQKEVGSIGVRKPLYDWFCDTCGKRLGDNFTDRWRYYSDKFLSSTPCIEVDASWSDGYDEFGGDDLLFCSLDCFLNYDNWEYPSVSSDPSDDIHINLSTELFRELLDRLRKE